MPDGKRPAILDVTEEQIFKTFGRAVPMCDLLREVHSNALRSVAVLEQAIKKMPLEKTEQIRGLEIVRDRQTANLGEITAVRHEMGC